MKKILIAAAAVALSFSAFALDVSTCAPIQGNVESYSVKEYSVYTEFGEYFRRLQGRQDYTLNADGLPTEVTEYTARDVAMGKVKTTYDAKGNELTKYYYDADQKMVWREITSYKNDLKCDSSEYNANGDLTSKVIYKFDGDNLVDESYYDAKGALVWKIIYKYNDAGLVCSKAMYSSNGDLDEEETYKYLDNGKLDVIGHIDAFEKTVSQEVFRYNASGVLVEVINYNAANIVDKRTQFKFDATGNVTRVSEYAVSQKFGSTVNELLSQKDYSYNY